MSDSVERSGAGLAKKLTAKLEQLPLTKRDRAIMGHASGMIHMVVADSVLAADSMETMTSAIEEILKSHLELLGESRKLL